MRAMAKEKKRPTSLFEKFIDGITPRDFALSVSEPCGRCRRVLSTASRRILMNVVAGVVTRPGAVPVEGQYTMMNDDRPVVDVIAVEQRTWVFCKHCFGGVLPLGTPLGSNVRVCDS